MKKFFITLMCIVMMVCFMPTVAMAEGGTPAIISGIDFIALADSAGNIVLDKDINLTSTAEIEANKSIVLDLNGHKITVAVESGLGSNTRHYYAIDNYGTFTLKDSVGGGSITARGIENLGKGVMTIESGKIISQDSNGGACIWNEATLFINGGLFNTLYEGTSSDTYGPGCLNNRGSAVITAGKFESVNKRTYAIISTGDIEITPAEGKTVNVAGAHGGLGIDAGTAVVNGGTYTSTDYYGLYVSNDGVGTDPMTAAVTVNGGTFSGAYYSVWIGSDHNKPVNSTIRINDGEFQKPLNAQENTREGAIVVAGGTFSSDVSQYVPEGTKVVEKDGIFTLEPADNAVAQVGDAGFTTLQAAINAATPGQTVTLLNNVDSITDILYINKNLTLDLGKSTLTTQTDYSFIVYPNISFTLQNGTLKNTSGIGFGIVASKSSTITVAKDAKIETKGSALFGSNNKAEEGHVTFNVSGTLDCEYIGIWGQGPNNTFNVNGATITSKYFGVYQNGSFGGCKINIKNSTITDEAGDGVAVYISNNKGNAGNPEQGMQELTIENSIITGATAVEAKYTNINIKGSRTKITATGTPADTTLNNNGPVTTGYAIAVTHNGALKEDGSIKSADSACGKITIEGGTFNGLIGIQEPLNATTAAEISVSGGKFNQELPKEYLAPGVVQDSKGNVYKPYYGGSIPTDSLKTARTEAIKAVTDYVNPADYEEAQQAEIKTIVDNAKKDIEAAKTADEIKAIEAAAKAELDKLETAEEMSLIRAIGETKFVARSKAVTLKNGKKAIKITWYDKNGKEVKFDGVEIFRSTKRYSGYGKEPIYVSKSGVYYNTAITPGTKYYYKVRGYVLVNGEKVYTDYSTKAWRTA